ncbi:glutathione hydrolase 5 proenzyme isoform X2 [Pygocentrus nattereri]|uniref:Glutathione hydrolase n=1 Tax=Pygocentrus nattereri TaxID=42514 RepID=A0A3B4DZP7_PYGNA|nr:glutathione hydrolase 5 proenzyme isoform X2 [Pygocentrus nattereri]
MREELRRSSEGGFSTPAVVHGALIVVWDSVRMGKERRRLVCVCCGLVVAVAAVLLIIVCVSRSKCPGRRFSHGAVAADSLMCSNIGRDILLEGGSAVDAAISALLCTALVNPQSMGLGGGAIFTIMDKSGKVKVISSRETVPKNFTQDLLKRCPKTFQLAAGQEWIGVPGELRGYAIAHNMYGKLPWPRLFEPIIKLARDGFPMPAYLAKFLQHKFIKPVVEKFLCQVFCHKNKTALDVGDTLKYPKLADTLEIIAKQGPEAFYTGQVAQDLVQDVQEAGGKLSLEDLESFKVRVDEAHTVSLGEYEMHIPPLPAGGAMISLILNIMHGFGLSPASLQGNQTALTLHRYIEAAKFANGQRRNIKDPWYSHQNVDYMMESSFAEKVRAMISDHSTHSTSFYNITPFSDRFGTTHVSVLAADGSAVSVTSTINHIFGSFVYSPRTGIILNNELADFCDRADSISAGEQPPSSMAPTILQSKDRKKILVIGGSGGSMITTAIAQSVMNHLWLGKSLKDAISEKVVFVDGQNSVNFEPGFQQSLIEEMRTRGHSIKDRDIFLNVVNAVEKEHGCISAFSDERKNGKAAGY